MRRLLHGDSRLWRSMLCGPLVFSRDASGLCHGDRLSARQRASARNGLSYFRWSHGGPICLRCRQRGRDRRLLAPPICEGHAEGIKN
jgi:hypothetical protein